jgi:hypothetical protein
VTRLDLKKVCWESFQVLTWSELPNSKKTTVVVVVVLVLVLVLVVVVVVFLLLLTFQTIFNLLF